MFDVEEQMAQENAEGYEKAYVEVNHELDIRNKLVVAEEQQDSFYEEVHDEQKATNDSEGSFEYGYDKGDLIMTKEHKEEKVVTKAKKGVTKETYIRFGVSFVMILIVCFGLPALKEKVAKDWFVSGIMTVAQIVFMLVAMYMMLISVLSILRLYVPAVDQLLTKGVDGTEKTGFGPRLTEEVVEKKVIRKEEQFKVKMPAELMGHTIDAKES